MKASVPDGVKPVKVTWLDAWSESSLDELDLDRFTELAPFISCGFLLKENRKTIVICQGILPKQIPSDSTIFRNALAIPRNQILKIEELTEIQTPEREKHK